MGSNTVTKTRAIGGGTLDMGKEARVGMELKVGEVESSDPDVIDVKFKRKREGWSGEGIVKGNEEVVEDSPLVNTIIFPIIRQDFILKALETLDTYTPSGTFKTIIIDQSEWNDEFQRELWNAADIVIKPSLNYGFAQASNIGIRLSTTKYVTIANDDLEFMPDWWEGIERTFERFENALVASPMSPKEPGWGYGEDGYRIHCPYEEAFSMETVRKLIESKGGAVIDAIPMWCAVFKRELFLEEVGLFDEMFFPGGGEDYDMDARVYQAGYRALASSYSWVWHHWGQSKDEKSGFDVSLPNARDHWNKLSTKGFGEDGLWEPDCDVWGNDCERTRGVFRAEL